MTAERCEKLWTSETEYQHYRVTNVVLSVLESILKRWLKLHTVHSSDLGGVKSLNRIHWTS